MATPENVAAVARVDPEIAAKQRFKQPAAGFDFNYSVERFGRDGVGNQFRSHPNLTGMATDKTAITVPKIKLAKALLGIPQKK